MPFLINRVYIIINSTALYVSSTHNGAEHARFEVANARSNLVQLVPCDGTFPIDFYYALPVNR